MENQTTYKYISGVKLTLEFLLIKWFSPGLNSKLHPTRRNDILSTTYFVWNLTFYPIWISLVIIYSQLTYIIFPWYRSSSVVYLIFLYIVIYCRSYKMAAYVNLLKWSYHTALEAWFLNTTSFRYYMIYEHSPWCSMNLSL